MRFGGLDVSKSATGWGIVGPGQVKAGTFRCPVKHPFELKAGALDAGYSGRVGVWFAQAIDAWLIEARPDEVAIEQPLPAIGPRKRAVIDTSSEWAGQAIKMEEVGGSNFAANHLLQGLAFEAARLCAMRGIPARYVSSQTWRSTFKIGQAPKDEKNTSGWYKRRAKSVCLANGLEVKSGDAAEGLCLALYLRKQYYPEDDLFSVAAK